MDPKSTDLGCGKFFLFSFSSVMYLVLFRGIYIMSTKKLNFLLSVILLYLTSVISWLESVRAMLFSKPHCSEAFTKEGCLTSAIEALFSLNNVR